jgi:hypothetical protein
MKHLTVAFLIFGLCVLLSATGFAQPFPITDVRALGMGGAFVAAGEGIGAVQYNPALLGEDSTAGVVFPEVVLRIEDHINLADLIDRLNELGPTSEAVTILEELDQGDGLDAQASGAVGAGFGVFGISAGVTYSQVIFGAAYPVNISTNPADLPDDNYNRLQYGAVEARQIILTGAKSFGGITVGANLRNIDATTYNNSEWLFEDPGIDIGDMTEGAESDESAVAVDAGAVLNLAPILDVGIVAKDVNGPELGDWKFEPRYRIGVALKFPVLTVAADYDVTEDDVFGTEYKDWALGAEVDMWTIALRGGVSKNLGLSGSPTLIHLGVGLGFLDIAAAYAEEGEYYMAGVNLALGF